MIFIIQFQFEWINSRGVIRRDDGGMVKKLKSEATYNLMMSGSDAFRVGKGYW